MGKFDAKTFNAEAFGRYVSRIPDTRRNKLLEAGVLRVNPDLVGAMAAQSAGNYLTRPLFGLIGGDPVNYDGGTDITSDTEDTYTQGVIVVGRAKGFKEKDFSYDVTGKVPFMSNVANQIVKYWANVDQDILISTLKGIFGVAAFADSHIYDIKGEVGVTSLNTGIQKACGDNKDIFKVAIMHSVIATQLENKQLLEYLKYTDKDGVQRPTNIAYWNGRLVLVDDGMPSENAYAKTTDVALDSTKTYYTLSNKGVYSAVSNPSVDNIATYYELVGQSYTTFVLGEGAFEYADVGVYKPFEMWRDPKTNGGEEILYSRQRKIYAPFGFSFKNNSSIKSPTNANLEDSANWELVNNGADTNPKTISLKAIPIVAIKSIA